MHLNRARILALDLHILQSLHWVQIQHMLLQKIVAVNLSAECPQIKKKNRGQNKSGGQIGYLEQSLKKTKARINAAYAILFKEEFQ